MQMPKLEYGDTKENLTLRLEAVENRIKRIKFEMRLMKDELNCLQEIKILVNTKLKMVGH